MNKILSALSLVGFIVASIKADATSQSTPQVASDTPQTYAPAATTTYQSGDAHSLENKAYDPSLYQSFVPQDAVQQYVQQYGGGQYTGQALEGFLIPTYKTTEVVPLTSFSFLRSFLPGPKILIAIVAKVVALAATAIGIVLFGGAITSFVCAFTPLCTLSILGSPLALLRKEAKDMVEKIGSEVNADRIKRAADLLKLAYDKFHQMK